MRQYIIISIILILPLQGFCDRYWISNRQNINNDIQTIERDGGLIKDIKTTRVNDYDVSYTIIYKNQPTVISEETFKEFDEIINQRIKLSN